MNDVTLKPCAHCGYDKIRIIPTEEMRERGFPKLVVCDGCNATSPNEEAWNLRNESLPEMVEALERLGSMQAFEMSRMIDPDKDKELLARIDYARALIKKYRGE